ncbi:MAG: head GIN domain-containing protein [Pseudomonadota bacterium]
MLRTLISLACVAALSGCAIIIAPNDGDIQVRTPFSSDAIRGNGQSITEQRPVSAASVLDVSGPVAVEVRVGQAAAVEVQADSNLLPLIHTESNGGTLRIWVDGNVSSHNEMRVKYTVPQLSQVLASGSGQLRVTDLNGGALTIISSGSRRTDLAGRVGRLDVQVSGSGGINASGLQASAANVSLNGSGRMSLGQVNGEAMTINIRGSGDLQASGTVQTLNANVYGSGGANLLGLSTQQADLNTHGSGDITASVKGALVAQSNGSGRITVYGNPAQRTLNGKHIQVVN